MYNWCLGAKRSIVLATCLVFGLSFAAVLLGIVPPFTEETARAVNVSFQSHLFSFLFATYFVCFDSSSCTLHCSHDTVLTMNHSKFLYTHTHTHIYYIYIHLLREKSIVFLLQQLRSTIEGS